MNPQNETLRSHLALIAGRERKFSDLNVRRAKFAQQASGADRASMTVQALKAERLEFLGCVAVDGADRAEVATLDARIRDAEHVAASEQESCEIGRAGMGRLDRELAAASVELVQAHKQTQALKSQAGVELVNMGLTGYHQGFFSKD